LTFAKSAPARVMRLSVINAVRAATPMMPE